MKLILVIDDDAEYRETLQELLGGQFRCVAADSGSAGLEMAKNEKPDLILLDITMPGMDGFEVCKELQADEKTKDIPLVMLTGETGIESKLKGLDLGAEDYICKPFDPRELMARIRARVRVAERRPSREAPSELGNLRVNVRSHQVWVGENEVKLTHLEFDLLKYFLEHPNEVVDRARLLEEVWPDTTVTDRTVDTHMVNLRRKLKGVSHPIETVYGVGYILKIEE